MIYLDLPIVKWWFFMAMLNYHRAIGYIFPSCLGNWPGPGILPVSGSDTIGWHLGRGTLIHACLDHYYPWSTLWLYHYIYGVGSIPIKIPFLLGVIHIHKSPLWIDVNRRGTRFWHTAIYNPYCWWLNPIFLGHDSPWWISGAKYMSPIVIALRYGAAE